MLSKQTVQNRIKQNKEKLFHFGIDKIGLFGSYVKGEQKEESDIDIFISFQKEKETFNNFMGISYLLDEIFDGEKVEIVTKNGLSPYIGSKILEEVEYV